MLRGEEQKVWGDAGYQGIEKRPEHEGRDVDRYIAMRPGMRRQLPEDDIEAQAERLKTQVRAKVENSIRYIKRVFGYDKVRYRGLEKNGGRLHRLAAFTNLMVGKKYLLTQEMYA